MQIQWVCTKCRFENVDDPDYTARPICGGCEADFGWEDIPVPADEHLKQRAKIAAELVGAV